jgi:hydrogenase/urease accessory protein HupE
MRKLGLAALLLWMAAPACAHRLDEYLQATTIAMASDHLTLQLRLTPGVTVASRVLDDIGASGDTIPDARKEAYAERVRRDLSLTIDGAPSTLELVSAAFPAVSAMRHGAGEILLTFAANLPAGRPIHRLTLRNRHEQRIAVYLVNCLWPSAPNIRVLSQQRNIDQSLYQLEFTVASLAGSQQASPKPRAPERANEWATAGTFFIHGVHHILTGYDHLLFATALVLAVTSLWDLVKVVTAFTLAHSITLTLAALNMVRLPAQVVEPLIAVSIIFVAVQNIFWPMPARGYSRLAAAFFFGLFHGLGFAGGLLGKLCTGEFS